MRNSTVLVLSLRSLAHETIKNLVLAGIGRLIIMDNEKVSEEDLGGGFLFYEEKGAVGLNVSPHTTSLTLSEDTKLTTAYDRCAAANPVSKPPRGRDRSPDIGTVRGRRRGGDGRLPQAGEGRRCRGL